MTEMFMFTTSYWEEVLNNYNVLTNNNLRFSFIKMSFLYFKYFMLLAFVYFQTANYGPERSSTNSPAHSARKGFQAAAPKQ